MTDNATYTIRFADLGGDTAVPDLAIEASGVESLAQQVLRFAGDSHAGRDLSVTVEDMHRGRVFAGREVAGHFTITEEPFNSYTFDVVAVTTVKVRAGTEEQARAMIDGLNTISTQTTGDDIQAARDLNVFTSDYDVTYVSPRGHGYLVSAETKDGAEIEVSALELIPEPVLPHDLAGLRGELAEADRFLAGDDYADAHEALHDLAEAARKVLGGEPDATEEITRSGRPGRQLPANVASPEGNRFSNDAQTWEKELAVTQAALRKIRDGAGARAGAKPFKDVDPFIGEAFRIACDALPGGADLTGPGGGRDVADPAQSAVRTAQHSFPAADPLARPGQAATGPARPPGAAGTVTTAKAPRGRGR